MYSKTVVWSGAQNGWFVTNGTATKDVVTSVAGAGTTSETISPGGEYATYTTYFSPDFSIENSGSTDGSYSCSIHQAYTENSSDTGTYLVTKADPEGSSPFFYGLGYSGWELASFDPQTALSPAWPAFSTCTVDYGPNTTNDYSGASQPAGTSGTVSNHCLAGPLQLPSN
jgi:hypothetical protein